MWVRLARGLINLDKIVTIRATAEPAVEFGTEGKKTITMITPDFTTAERKVDEIEQALRNGASFFDMR